MTATKKFQLSDLPKIFKTHIEFIFEFAKNPVSKIRFLPDWDWPTLLILDGVLAALTGALGGIISQSLGSFFFGILLLPISSIICKSILAGFFFYFFEIFSKRKLQFFKVLQLVIIASFPAMILFSVSSLLPPVTLLGVAATCLLLIVGFVENFGLNRKSVIKLVAIIFIVYASMWVLTSIRGTRKLKEFKGQATPESLDILEQELNN